MFAAPSWATCLPGTMEAWGAVGRARATAQYQSDISQGLKRSAARACFLVAIPTAHVRRHTMGPGLIPHRIQRGFHLSAAVVRY